MAKAVSNTETSEGEPLMRLPWKRTTESTIAQSSGDAEMVRSKIATVEREIAQAGTELRRVSLEAALSDM